MSFVRQKIGARRTLIGGHVYIANHSSGDKFILPICTVCNRQSSRQNLQCDMYAVHLVSYKSQVDLSIEEEFRIINRQRLAFARISKWEKGWKEVREARPIQNIQGIKRFCKISREKFLSIVSRGQYDGRASMRSIASSASGFSRTSGSSKLSSQYGS